MKRSCDWQQFEIARNNFQHCESKLFDYRVAFLLDNFLHSKSLSELDKLMRMIQSPEQKHISEHTWCALWGMISQFTLTTYIKYTSACETILSHVDDPEVIGQGLWIMLEHMDLLHEPIFEKICQKTPVILVSFHQQSAKVSQSSCGKLVEDLFIVVVRSFLADVKNIFLEECIGLLIVRYLDWWFVHE